MRVRRLEGSTIWRDDAGGDETFIVDIGADPPRYWIDAIEVRADEFRRRAPARGVYRVNIGADDEQP